MFSLVDPDGTVRDRLPITMEKLRGFYSAMVEAREYDRRGMILQRQGRIATYAPFEGQEGAQIGAAAAIAPGDWVAGTYRDAALMWGAGYPWEKMILGRIGDERGGAAPEGVNVLPPSLTVGGHMIHAVGLGWAERLKGTDRVALTSFGDGATSEGDFHEAMNFAAVYGAPVVFLCQNNGYAISFPVEEQTKAPSIAAKANGYGMPGALVDGNDVVAVFAAVSEAVAVARSGEGPSLIEAITYRIGPHTSADDPGRYRDDVEAEQWRSRDPMTRVRLLLEKAGGWSQEWQNQLEAGAASRIDAAIEVAEAVVRPTRASMLSRMFEEPTPSLTEQLGWSDDE